MRVALHASTWHSGRGMEEFNTSLVREKIIFVDGSPDEGGLAKEPVVIRSNRIFLRLGVVPVTEKVVIRAQNMHVTLRLAAKLLYHYYQDGLLLDRSASFDFAKQWDASLSAYDKEYNPDLWAAVYIGGKSVFKTVTSPFVDVIEKCALLSIDNYDATMEVTENALKQIGRAVRINHSSNVATTFSDNGVTMRCGIIHRSSDKDTTFSFTVTGGIQRERVVQSIGMVAAYLELFNLRFTIDNLQNKIRKGVVQRAGPESAQIRAAISRQGLINKAILSFESTYDVKYRPEKPDLFSDM